MLKLLYWALDRAASAPIESLMTRQAYWQHHMSLGGLYIYLRGLSDVNSRPRADLARYCANQSSVMTCYIQ
jgi:hypothetical protein